MPTVVTIRQIAKEWNVKRQAVHGYIKIHNPRGLGIDVYVDDNTGLSSMTLSDFRKLERYRNRRQTP